MKGLAAGACVTSAVWLLTACGEAASPGWSLPEPVVRDSAGVTIVESTVSEEGPADRWVVESEPILTIGEAEGEDAYLFTEIVGVGRLPDGRIYALDMTTRELRFFDGEGRFLERRGGPGQGPGEVALPPLYTFQLPGDSLAVGEMAGRRIHVFDPDGAFVRRITPAFDHRPREGWIPSESCCRLLGPLSDGSWLVQYPEEGPEDAGGDRGEAEIVRVSAEGEVVGRLGRFPGGLWYQASPERPARVVRGLYTGTVVTALAGEGLLVGTGTEYRIDELDGEGRLLRSIRIDLEPPPFLDEHRRAYEAGYRAQAPDDSPQSQAMIRDRVDHLPDRLRAYSRILLDPEGRIWLVSRTPTYVTPAEERALVLEPDGTVLGRVEFPTDVSVREIGRDEIVGIRVGEMGVPGVVVHRIVRPG